MADKEVNVDSKYLEKLDEQVESFRKLGKSWGLTSEDIDRCVLLSLQKKIELPKATPARTFFGLVKTVCKLTIWLFGVLFLCSVCVSFHEPTQKFLSHNLEPYGYVILRTLRVMTLPISRNFNISSKWVTMYCSSFVSLLLDELTRYSVFYVNLTVYITYAYTRKSTMALQSYHNYTVLFTQEARSSSCEYYLFVNIFQTFMKMGV